MAKYTLDKIANRTRTGFFAAIFLLFVSYFLTYISSRKISIQDYYINHTNEVIHNLDNILGFVSTGESAFRGYLIASDKDYLAEYDKSLINIDTAFAQLKLLTADNEVQRNNLDTLRHYVNQKYIMMGKAVFELSTKQKFSISLLQGKEEDIANAKKLESQIKKMKQDEIDVRNEWSHKLSKYSKLIKILNVLSIIIAILLAIYSLIVYNKESRQRKIAARKAAVYKEELQERVKQLASLNTELIELRRLEKYAVTGRIARVIAHEVRNPLTNINLACEQLKSELEDESNSMLFKMIVRNSDRINQLVTDLLGTTRMAELTFSDESLNEVIDESLELANDRINLNHIKVVKDYEQDLPYVSLDKEKMKIAFLNIIVNAIEAMSENGVLTISTQNENGKCSVKFSDNGVGLKKTEVDRLFEPYFTTKEKGNGLGLANCQ
ncbi:MAG TPA: CHASE3 domain-containing protein, partial [Hanamia sp.]